MRWLDVRSRRLAHHRFALGLAFHQHMDPPRQNIDLAALAGHNVRQILHRADQMRRAFFKAVQTIHHPHPLLAETSPKR